MNLKKHKNIFKKLVFIGILICSLFAFTNDVYAEEESYAKCSYSNGDSYKIHVEISGGKITKQESEKGSFSGEIVKNIKYEDFIDGSGNLICPTLYRFKEGSVNMGDLKDKVFSNHQEGIDACNIMSNYSPTCMNPNDAMPSSGLHSLTTINAEIHNKKEEEQGGSETHNPGYFAKCLYSNEGAIAGDRFDLFAEILTNGKVDVNVSSTNPGYLKNVHTNIKSNDFFSEENTGDLFCPRLYYFIQNGQLFIEKDENVLLDTLTTKFCTLDRDRCRDKFINSLVAKGKHIVDQNGEEGSASSVDFNNENILNDGTTYYEDGTYSSNAPQMDPGQPFGDCTEIFGPNSETLNLLKESFRAITIVAPIIVIVLSIMDFIKATASGDDKAVKEAQSKFVKRLVICVLIFFLPNILKILFNLVGNQFGICDIA